MKTIDSVALPSRCSVSPAVVAGRRTVSASRAGARWAASVARWWCAVSRRRSLASAVSTAAGSAVAVSAGRGRRTLIPGVGVAWDRVVAAVSLCQRVLSVLTLQDLLWRATVWVIVALSTAAVTRAWGFS